MSLSSLRSLRLRIELPFFSFKPSAGVSAGWCGIVCKSMW
ncbi:hypothetical protein COLO4_38306 [Corchorus olitorius]|uniref:Uncharacterized protein n=1 Tax=Corchorus olitorius TaxID=93759 RepID=A0A1R3FVM3_9ROSI|nr:hypothetical protein COLO4_38306 [Corchorus olitorius]